MRALVSGAALLFVLFSTGSPAESAERRTDVVKAVEKVSPAVVNINTVIRSETSPFRSRSGLPGFFGDFYRPRSIERQSLGSGVIIRTDGYIITNNHVIDGASSIRVTLADDREFDAEVIGADASSDIAVIKVNSKKPLPAVAFGQSNDIMIGERVIAIGNPFGLKHTVTTGIISAVGRDIKGEGGRILADFIQLDASINPGNSGGALLNINGELIGINSAIYRSAEGIGFAIPIDRARRIVEDLIDFGEVVRGWTGFFAGELSPAFARKLSYSGQSGAVVTKVFGDSPAVVSGVEPGDIITHVGKKRVDNAQEYKSMIAGYTAGQKIHLSVVRFGEKLDIDITPKPITDRQADRIIAEWLALGVKQNSPRMKAIYRLYTGRGMVISKVDPSSELGTIGVREGDVLLRINRKATNSREELRLAVIDAANFGGAVVFIQRGATIYQITVSE